MHRLLPLFFCGLLLTGCDDVTRGADDAPGRVALEAPPEPVLAAVDSASLRAHLETLASDEMEGRATGTPGEQRAVEYIAAQMEAAGLEPAGDDGTFFQEVPLLGATPEIVEPLRFTLPDGEALTFAFVDEYTASTDQETDRVTVDGAELVFAGYGIDAPGYGWDDFGDADVSGKILLMFVNDPIAPESNPELFDGEALTYFGRWTYKYEEARRRGARGALLIHTEPTAGYPFQVVSGGARGEQVQLATPPDDPLALKGWLSEAAAERLAGALGTSVEAWFEAANDPSFAAQPLGVTVSSDVAYTTRRFAGRNVVGKLTGTERPDEAIVFTAHHDHLGIGEPDAEGDAIYNGAVDNATGVAMVLAAAEAFGAAPERPDRSLVFVTLTAEESGLLGAEHYTRFPHLPMDATIANINLDMGNPYGPTDDIVGLGADKSELGPLFEAAAASEDLEVVPDPNPNQGYFFRSDQLPFARAGVPAVFVNPGMDFRGRAPEYGRERFDAFNSTSYHQASDEFDPTWPMEGMLQQTRVAVRLAYHLANTTVRPAWNPEEAFAAARE